MGRYSWSRLTHLQLGRLGEYAVRMEFALYGFEVCTSDVDEKGIDLVVRRPPGPFHEIQVKSVLRSTYVYMRKDRFPLLPERLVALARFPDERPPELFLIPATAWRSPNALLVDRDYEGHESSPEYGIQLSDASLPLLSRYAFGDAVERLALPMP